MKKISTILVLSALLILGSISLSAKVFEEEKFVKTRSTGDKIYQDSSDQFFVNKGFKEGFERGKEVGYANATKDNQASLARYENYIKSIEVGKYLSKKSRITPPRIYQEKLPNGNIAVKIKGCQITGELSPSDILSFPIDMGGSTRSPSYNGNSISSSKYEESDISDSVFLAGVDRKKRAMLPKKASRYTKGTFEMFPDTGFYRELFTASGKPFSIQNGNKIRVMFESSDTADAFIQRHGLTQGKDYR